MFFRSACLRLRTWSQTPGGPLSDAADLHVSASLAGQDRNGGHKSRGGAAEKQQEAPRTRCAEQPGQGFSVRVVDPVSFSHDDTGRSRLSPFTQTHRDCFPVMRSLTIRQLTIGILKFLHF